MTVCLLQFQLDAETLSESLERLCATLDPKSLDKMSNPEVLLALEVQEGSDVRLFVQPKTVSEIESQQWFHLFKNKE